MLTFFRNEQGVPGVVVEETALKNEQLKNKDGENATLYNHYKGKRTKDFYKPLNFTGKMDMDGKPIEDKPAEKSSADPDEMHVGSTMIDGDNWHLHSLVRFHTC